MSSPSSDPAGNSGVFSSLPLYIDPQEDRDWPRDPARPDKHIDPATGIWPVCQWGAECGRGFVGNARFARGSEKVIPRTNRSQQRRRQQKGSRDGRKAFV